MEKGPEGPAHPLLRLRMCHNVVRALPYDRRLRRPGHAHGRHQPYVGHRALRASLSSRPAHAGTAEPLRVSPPEAVAYLLELVVQRMVVEDHRIIIEHVVPSGPIRLQPERHHLRASWGLIHQPHLQVGTRCGRVHSGPFSRVSGRRGMSHTRRARGTTGKGQHHRRRPQDTVDFTPHICKGNHGEGCPLGRRTKRQHR
jgi:hypothetical protein